MKHSSTEKAIEDGRKFLHAGGSQFILLGCLLVDGFSSARARQIIAWAKKGVPKIRAHSDPAQW